MEEAINQVKELLKPFAAGPVEWVRIPTNQALSANGLAMTVILVDSACTADVLLDLISAIAGKLLHAVQEEKLVVVQITFGKSDGDRVERCYRIMIPAEKLAQTIILKELPHTYENDPKTIRGYWFGKFERQSQD